MPYTYILDDNIKSNKELLFSFVVEPLRDHGHIFEWPSPF